MMLCSNHNNRSSIATEWRSSRKNSTCNILVITAVLLLLLLDPALGQGTVVSMELINNLSYRYPSNTRWSFHSNEWDVDGDGIKDWVAIYKSRNETTREVTTTTTGVHMYLSSSMDGDRFHIDLPTIEMKLPNTFSAKCLQFSGPAVIILLSSMGESMEIDFVQDLRHEARKGEVLQVDLSSSQSLSARTRACAEDESTTDCDPCCGPPPCCIQSGGGSGGDNDHDNWIDVLSVDWGC